MSAEPTYDSIRKRVGKVLLSQKTDEEKQHAFNFRGLKDQIKQEIRQQITIFKNELIGDLKTESRLYMTSALVTGLVIGYLGCYYMKFRS